jgi:putative salt-induced outer membrane protein
MYRLDIIRRIAQNPVSVRTISRETFMYVRQPPTTALLAGLVAVLFLLPPATAQQASPVWETSTELELGAVYTSGNTENENLRIGAEFDASKAAWEYAVEFEGFRSSKEDELAAQRTYLVGTTQYNYGDDHFAQLRASHERDKFSGYEQQSDLVVSYGQLLLRNRDNMTLDYTVGGGVRNSDDGITTTNEAILRLSTNYTWDFNDNVRFIQELSTEPGDSATITS